MSRNSGTRFSEKDMRKTNEFRALLIQSKRDDVLQKTNISPDPDRAMAKSPESAEDRLIARYFRPLATAPGAFGLVDDAAALAPPPGCDIVLTTDGVIAGVHFIPDDPPDMIGRKVLRMNLSDLAAKGAKPLGFLMSVALPEGFGEAWLSGFTAGLAEDAEKLRCSLFRGDTGCTA